MGGEGIVGKLVLPAKKGGWVHKEGGRRDYCGSVGFDAYS